MYWLFFLLLVVQSCAATKKRHHNNTLTRHNWNVDKKNVMSSSERANKLKILTMEGQSGWLEMVKKEIQSTAEKIYQELQEGREKREKDNNKKEDFLELQQDLSAPTQLVTDVKDILSDKFSDIEARAIMENRLTEIITKWEEYDDEDKKSLIATFEVLKKYLEPYGNGYKNQLRSFNGAAYILGAISQNFPANGQLYSVGMGFNTPLMGLFGQGKEYEYFLDLIEKPIEDALTKFPNPTLQQQKKGMVDAINSYSHFNYKLMMEKRPIEDDDLETMHFQDTSFIGELATQIETMFKNNKANEAQKCLAYCELYTKLTLVKDLMLTQLVSMTSIFSRKAALYAAYQQHIRDATSLLLEPLFNADFRNNILRSFKVEQNVITNAYATVVLSLGIYDTSQDGLYCLRTSQGLQDYVWLTDDDTFTFGGKPYTTLAPHIDSRNCYWKLVPQGNKLFYVVSQKECGRTKNSHCGWMLSVIENGGEAFANLEEEKNLWDIDGGVWFRIRTRKGCDGNSQYSKYCNKDMRVIRTYRNRPGSVERTSLPLGKIVPSDGKNHWRLIKGDPKKPL